MTNTMQCGLVLNLVAARDLFDANLIGNIRGGYSLLYQPSTNTRWPS